MKKAFSEWLLIKHSIGILLSVLIFTSNAPLLAKTCTVLDSNGQVPVAKEDALFRLLQVASDCPENVQSLKGLLNQNRLATNPYMVANRGIHNPAFGSFSFFEEAVGTSDFLREPIQPGEFFFGHFTAEQNKEVVSDQEPSQGKLLVELIAWDSAKRLFNFYELIGTGTGGQWFYRGDSADILSDNAELYLNPQGPKFGSALRCSACHTSGGPILKELEAPHNDWWTTSRPLPFAPNTLSAEIELWVKGLKDASEFSQSVKTGIDLLESSPSYQNAKQKLSLPARLRPLFCETEINLESDTAPLETGLNSMQIASASVISPLLAVGPLSIDATAYRQLLVSNRMRFPETNRRDADHGWLVPVKGYSDLAAIQTLLNQTVIDEEFVADVLAIDSERPVFSPKRCALVRLVPKEGLSSFPERLKASSLPGARELYENLTDPIRNRNFHVQNAKEALVKARLALSTPAGQAQAFKNLLAGRKAVLDSEISKSPRGQILEPGFRIVFPVPK